MRKNALDEEIRRGMMGLIIYGDERINCIVQEVNSYGKRVKIFNSKNQSLEEFNLRDNGDFIQVGLPTEEKSPRLIFPIFIRKALFGLYEMKSRIR